MNGQPNDEMYDDEAFIGVEEGLITDGKVLDDLDAEGMHPRRFACAVRISSAGRAASVILRLAGMQT